MARQDSLTSRIAVSGGFIRRTLLLSSAASLTAVPVPSLAQSSEIDEVVITARRREERLQDVPISVTVLGAQQIDDLKLNSGTDLAAQTPNLRVSLAGNEDQPRFSMRGLAQFDFNLNASSPTAVFYDEVYIASQYLGGPQMFDMERVEVLRGPQGTLFGKNSTAGAVNFISRSPDPDGGGTRYFAGDYGSNNYYRLSGAGDMVLVEDKLAARLAFNASSSDGWVENLNPDPEARDLSSIDNHAVRLSLAYRNDAFDATLKMFNTRSRPTAIGIIGKGLCPSITPAGTNRCDAFAPGLAGTDVNIAGVNPRLHPVTGAPMGRREGAYDRSGKIEVDGNGGWLTMNWSLGDYTLTSLTSYIDGSFMNLVDGDGSIANLFTLDFFAEQDEFTQDLRITSDLDGPANFIAGLYYATDEISPTTVSGFGGPVFFLSGTTSYTQTRKSVAAYVDGTYALNDDWELYAGLRVTKDEGEATDYQVISFPNVRSTLEGVEYDDTEPTGRLGLRYRISDDIMAYGHIATGYRSSAINGGADTQEELNVARPEMLDTLEFGLKSSLLGGRLLLNGSYYFYEFTDQQFRNASPRLTNPISQVLVNAAEAELQGIEIEVIASVTDNFRIIAGLGLVDSEYKSLVLRDEAGRDVDLSGNELLEAASYTYNIAADYTVNLDNGSALMFMVNGSGVGKRYFTAFNDMPPNDINVSNASWESNARVSFLSADGQIEVGIWGKNLNNNSEVQWAVAPAIFGIQFTTLPYPRRYGMDFRFNF